jgi:16S rRNA (cytosine967-C5)-methyltransferase
MAARAGLRLYAHDVAPGRMADLPGRSERAGVQVTLTDRPEAEAPYDLALVDAPCSGSGSWRRDPEGKWRLTPERLAELVALQAGILERVLPLVAGEGVLAYATCSLLEAENRGQVEAFLGRHPDWGLVKDRVLTPLSGGDGFYVAILRRG